MKSQLHSSFYLFHLEQYIKGNLH